MMKFKVGQKVRCVEGRGDSGSGWELGKVFTIKSTYDDKHYPMYAGASGLGVFGDHLELVTKTIEDVDYPDIIESGNCKRKVLGRINDLVFMSYEYDFNASSTERTISELKELDFKIVQEEVEEEKMITIKGKEYSEDTIHKSLKEYVK